MRFLQSSGMKARKKKPARKPAKRLAGKAAKRKAKAGKRGTAIIVTKTIHAPKSSINSAKISTHELQKMRAFGVLPFELRRELYKRLGKK